MTVEGARVDEMADFLEEVAIFSVLPRGLLHELAEHCRRRPVPKKTVLFFQNDPAHSMYIVESGSVSILLSSEDGQELILGEMRRGDHFGELALITGRSRSTSAIASIKSEVIIMPGEVFMSALADYPVMARSLLESTAGRLYRSTAREGALAFLDAPARLARTLLLLNENAPDPGYITVSQESLARRTGLTRQTVAKILGRWRRAGWLITGRGRIVLLDLSSLRMTERQRLG